MGATEILRAERQALCETFETVGPGGPTLCDGWLTADLAAHLVVRDRRIDAMPGIVFGGPFARHTQRLMDQAKARGFDWMLDTLRAGPPLAHRLGPMAGVNVVEYWIHHEDVRRAAGSAPRPPDPPVDEILWRSIGWSARFAVRRVRSAGVEIVERGERGRRRRLTRAEPRVTVTGAPGELALFFSGRKEAAVVELDGPPEAVALVVAARFGI